ncbi:hypothetical protein [Rahnella sp. PCH160]|uniref:hypothetical protein n=1 Tax=Rahnella sp. PCH160 TaxID=3447928 RepID=UPI0039FCD2CD
MSRLLQELKVVAVVQFNKEEALVFNRPVSFTYELAGKDYVGTDGPLTNYLYFERAGGYFKAFAGSELTLNMKDGSVQKIKDHWWHGTKKDQIDIAVGDVDSLKKCYVFSSASVSKSEFQALRDTYEGCIYPYWDYEKVIKFDDMRKSLYRSVFHGEKRIKALIGEVKKKHLAMKEQPHD